VSGFYRLDPFLVCLAFFVLLLVAEEVGFGLKKRMRADSKGVAKEDIALLLGAVLTLLSLMLGFTYAMSEDRYEARRQLVIDEANAIGTVYLRAQTLPEPRSSEIQELLRQYAELRVEIAGIKDDAPDKIREIDDRTKQLHGLMWSHAVVLARESPDPVVAVFLESLNEMIDIHGSRLAAFRDHVPFSIYPVLFIGSAIALWLVGFYFGMHGQRARILAVILAVLVATVMWLILDLDQPTRGTIKASQQSLIDLQRDLSQPSLKPKE
jgi:hypothetical protein